MTQDVDFDATVDEVKQQIRDLEDPDYQSLLSQEKGTKDRKTVKEFIQDRMDSSEVEIEEEDVEDELVEEIEEETRGGLLGDLSPEVVLVAGLAGGLIIGLLLGMVFDLSAANSEITPQEAEDRVSDIIGLQFDDYEITDSEMRSGMYYVSANITQQVPVQGNETETQTQEFEQNFYLTSDGKYLFPEQRQLGQVISPIDVDSEIERAQQQQQEVDPEDLEQELNSSE